ncbi:YeiH family protein [Bosea sp. LjRoot237]|uniref:YeiH family protein n=1 Tax=Bosea sp. LjRoot237 TaxID=3342292 RepID=UPI003ECCF873
MTAHGTDAASRGLLGRLVWQARDILPGLALCSGVSLAAKLFERLEEFAFGRAWLEALVLAILIGTAVRTVWTPGQRWRGGIVYSARTLLEIAVVLLGASLSAATILAAGPALLAGIAGIVLVAIVSSYAIARALKLPRRMAILIACGNSICGNSAIAAVAPVIGASSKDVTSSIAFTAVLGVLVVLGLPLLVPVLGLSETQFGIMAGLTVYAVPQVLAATAPVGAMAVQIGTLVKLVRVLMLAPVVLALSLLAGRLCKEADEAAPAITTGQYPARRAVPLHLLVPWFIVLFLVMAALRSAGAIPAVLLPGVAATAKALTVVSMAALGLGVDIRTVAKAGPRVTLAVTLSLITLSAISYALVRLLGVV